MNEKKVWQILNISPTNDESEIKTAYRKELVNNNPEDKPLEFKELRNAYETAIKMIREKGQVNENKEKNAVDIWLEKVKDVYENYESRINSECWKKLLKDDVCIGLDFSAEACEKLLIFMMTYCNVPCKVFSEINKTFLIEQFQKELCEKFPKDYINFIITKSRDDEKDSFAFDLFEKLDIEDCSIYDGYIDSYINYINKVDEDTDVEEIEKELNNLRKAEIYHPYTDVEEIFLSIKKDDMDTAKSFVEKFMINEKFMANEKIRYAIAYYQNRIGEYDKACENLDVILGNISQSILANMEYIYALMKKEQYEDAKERSIELLEKYGNIDKVVEFVHEANEKLIEKFNANKDLKDDEKILELAWCYFQNEKFEKCIALLDEYKPDEENDFEYCNLRGRCLLANKQYEEALPYLKAWKEKYKSLKDDGSKKYKNRIRRKAYSNYVLAITYTKLAEKLDDDTCEQAIEYYREAVEELEKAVELEKDKRELLHYKERQANVCIKLGEYERCIAISNEIIEDVEEYYPAYINRQEAYFKLREPQKVLDDFNEIIRFEPTYTKAYILAIKIFLAYSQYEDALDIYETAKEHIEDSEELELMKYKILYCIEDKKEAIKNMISELLELKERAIEKGQESDLEDISEIDVRVCMMYMSLGNISKSLEYIELALKQNDTKPEHHWLKADILYACDRYEEAYEIYKKIEEELSYSIEFLIKMAKCEGIVVGVKEALQTLLKASKVDSEHEYINDLIMKYYRFLYTKYYDVEYFTKAEEYAKYQLEIDDSACYYINRGILYLEGGEIQKALDDFNVAKKKNPSDITINNNIGCAYLRLGMYEEAIQSFELVLNGEYDFEIKGNEKVLYDRLYTAYFALEMYEKAEKCLLKAIELFPKDEGFLESLCDVYAHTNKHQERIELWKVIMKKNNSMEKVIEGYLEIAISYAEMGKYTKSLEIYKKALGFAKGNNLFLRKIYTGMGLFFEKYKIRLRKARNYYKMALDLTSENEESYIDACFDYGRISSLLGDVEDANEYYQKAVSMYDDMYGDINNYLEYPVYSQARYYSVGKAAYYAGQIDDAKKYFESMKMKPLCENCTYRACYEAVIGQAMLCEAEENYDKALELYIEASDINSSSKLCKNKILELKKKTKRGKV